VSQGFQNFFLLTTLEPSSNMSLLLTGLPKNQIFEFFYRAVNELGPGGDS
jgi:hypothetical protein